MPLLNRKQRRKLTAEQIDDRMEKTKNEVAGAFMSVWIEALYDDGVDYDKICDYVKKAVALYESVDDVGEYRKKVYEKTGIGIVGEQ